VGKKNENVSGPGLLSTRLNSENLQAAKALGKVTTYTVTRTEDFNATNTQYSILAETAQQLSFHSPEGDTVSTARHIVWYV